MNSFYKFIFIACFSLLSTALLSQNQNRVLTLINFDDIQNAPSSFATAGPAQYEYLNYGVTFSGPGPWDGGAIVSETLPIAVTGFSPPNFLAFNAAANLSGGGTPQGPERIIFNPPVSFVSLMAGGDQSGIIEVFAYDEDDLLIDYAQINGNVALQELTVSGDGIAEIYVENNMQYLVIDDLYFDTYLPPDNIAIDFDTLTGNVNVNWDYAGINGFYEDFSDEWAENWISISGYWLPGSAFYKGESVDLAVNSTFYNCNFEDFEMEAKVAKMNGSDFNYGIYFHGDPSSINPNGEWKNSYQVALSTSGQWALFKYENGMNQIIQDWIGSPDLLTGLAVFNAIRIVRDAGNIEVYFNGVFQNSYFDDTFSSGKVGLKMLDNALNGIMICDYVDVKTINDNPGNFLHFNFYKNDSLIANTNNLTYTDQISSYGINGYQVKALYDDGESQGTDTEILWWTDSPLFQQNPMSHTGFWYALISDFHSTPMTQRVYDNFSGIDELITGIEFIGINMEDQGGTYVPCDNEDPMNFLITFYEDNAGMPGNLIESFTANINRVEPGMEYGASFSFPMYLYRADFSDTLRMENGWIAIEGTGQQSPDCLFFWICSMKGDRNSYTWNGTVFNHYDVDLAFTLKGGWKPNPPENLSANLNDQNGRVDLSWEYTPSSNKNFKYYSVYRNASNIGIAISPQFTDNLPANAIYEYYITAVYDDGESDPSNTISVDWNNQGILEIDGFEVKIYPNPANEILVIETEAEIEKISLYSFNGQCLLSTILSDNKIILNLENISAGLYHMIIRTKTDQITQKIIVKSE